MANSEKIGDGKFVAFAYKVTDADNGDLLFEAKASAPDVMVYGVSQEVIPGLVATIKGLAAGDKFSVTLPPEVAFGPREEEYVQHIPIDAFMRDGKVIPELKEGAMLDMLTNTQTIVTGIVTKVTPEEVVMDFNHPFAGKTVTFDGEIIEVRDATEEELHPKHGCGGCGCAHHEGEGCGCHSEGESCGCHGEGDACGCGEGCDCGDKCECGDSCECGDKK